MRVVICFVRWELLYVGTFFFLVGYFGVAKAWLPMVLKVHVRNFHCGSFTSLRCVNFDDSTSNNNLSSHPTTKSKKTSSEYVLELLQRNFQGDFDNYNQVIQDRKNGLLPREGGGHENFHCTLIPLTEYGRLAAFYFDGNPRRIFRFRYYELLPPGVSSDSIEMRLYTLQPDLEALLRQHSETPMEWPNLFAAFDNGSPLEDKINYLPNCEISWSQERDPIQHSYLNTTTTTTPTTTFDLEEDTCLHAVMVHGEAIVDSTLIPGMKIRILDQLSLFDDIFYINDRGFDPKTGAFIYGNQRGVPYRLERVTTLEEDPNETTTTAGRQRRKIVNPDLAWTLGDSWRSPKEYEDRISAAGGLSVQMRAPPPPKLESK